MFQIEPSPEVGPRGDTLRVVDHERDVWLQRVAGHGPDSGSAFKLVRQGKPAALDTDTQALVDGAGDSYVLVRISGIGDSPVVRRVANIPPVKFASERDRDDALELAAEALLVYGDYYDGLAKPEGRFRVSYDHRGEQHVATLATFGYTQTA